MPVGPKPRNKDWLEGIAARYDAIVIGSGLAGMTSANMLARQGHTVLLLEQHYNYGGMATWFKRKGGHIFDISLHGFPIGMRKTCRKYWTKEIADGIVQLKGIRFDNPQFSLWTTFDRVDFTRILVEQMQVERSAIDGFFDAARQMNFFDDQTMTTRELFEQFFPGRNDVVRLLMEPITYANGSTLDDPAITYGIVFSNFMSKGVYTFKGGTDVLIKMMKAELARNGVEVRNHALVERILVEGGRVRGVLANDREIQADCVVSNAGIINTVQKLVEPQHFDEQFLGAARAVRRNNSSCQVYLGIKKGESVDYIGDLFFTSVSPTYEAEQLLSFVPSSRTFSLYYPDTRPGLDRYTIVSSTNAHYQDWSEFSDEEYEIEKQKLIDGTLAALEGYLPGVTEKIDHFEAATPRTFKHYTRHIGGASFGTKFEGLQVSFDLPKQIEGLFHAGSVGIIMSGWLGAANYGVIVANKADSYLTAVKR